MFWSVIDSDLAALPDISIYSGFVLVKRGSIDIFFSLAEQIYLVYITTLKKEEAIIQF